MTTRKYSSRSQQTTLTGAITSGATSMTVVSGSTLLGGVTIPAGQTFTLVIDVDTALEEIVDATAVSTNTFTITRAIDGSSAQDHSAGAVVRHMAIGRDYRDANLHAEATGGYNDGSGNAHTMHGISSGEGDVVGTLKTQTLTNKTLTAPTITDPTITGTASAGAVLVFEGATADAYETTLTVVDPTQDNTITLPNTTGNVVLDSATQTLTNKTLTSPTISGSPVITGLSSVGMVTTSATPKSYVDSILGSATAAATSAASAAASATAAATSATSAAASASAAATSATNASASATAAATSATSAAASATAAATSATSSAASATTAQAWAIQLSTPVSGSDYSAKYNANLAATSATSAATSATSAANSATAATTSATSAAASATAAATSATSAAASATAAATSATSAALSYTTFNDQYLGAKSSAPTLNNSGGALVSGNLYFNTSDSTLYVYNVSAWQAAAVSTAGFATLGTNAFTAAQTITVSSGSAVPLKVTNAGTGNSFLVEDSATTDSTPFVIDASGTTILGATAALTSNVISGTSKLQIIGNGAANSSLGLTRTDPSTPVISFNSGSSGNTVASGYAIMNVSAGGYDGTSYALAGTIEMRVDGTVSTGVVPGRIAFLTANSSGVNTERMRIDSSGNVGIGVTPGSNRLSIGGTATGATTVSGVANAPTIASDITSQYRTFISSPSTQAAAFTLGNLRHFMASQGTIGVNSAVSNQVGFYVEANLTGATNNYGFQGALPAATGVWNIYINGTAANYFAGQTTVGSNSLTLGTANTVAQQFGVVSTAAANIATVIRGAASQTGDLTQWQNSAGTVLGYVSAAGSLVVGSGAGSGSAAVEIGNGRTADGNAYLDFIGDTTYTDYGFRVLRSSGANGNTVLTHRGTGSLSLIGTEANSLTLGTNNTTRMTIDSSGRVGIGTISTSTTLTTAKSMTGATVIYGILNNGTIASDVTSVARYYSANPATAASAFTITEVSNFYANAVSIGAGSTVTSQYGFIVASGFTGATNNYGFMAQTAAATGVWNFYASGTAANYFAGRVGVGGTVTSTAQMGVTNAQSASDVTFFTKNYASQTADSVAVQNSAGSLVWGVTAAGFMKYIAGNTATTVGAAGGASALPATPTGYLKIDIDGTEYKVPYYAA